MKGPRLLSFLATHWIGETLKGWGGMITSLVAAVRSLTFSRIRHATLLLCVFFGRFHTCIMARGCAFFSAISGHRSCYAAVGSLALPHICHGILLCISPGFHSHIMPRCCALSLYTSIQTSCYTAGRLSSPDVRNAMLGCVLLGQVRTYVILFL